MNTGEILIYQSKQGDIKIDVLLENETVWLTQEQMATLFGKGRSIITEHIGNIFKEGELDENVVIRKIRHTTQHVAIAAKSQSLAVPDSYSGDTVHAFMGFITADGKEISNSKYVGSLIVAS
jgi:hypothetical protein